MTDTKKLAVEAIDELHATIPYDVYCIIRGGLDEIESLRDRDEELEELWAQFGDIPMNQDTECIEASFMGWGAGTHREKIWHWFDARHSKGAAYLLMGVALDRDKVNKLIGLGDMCEECESYNCAFNANGVCKFPLIHGRRPTITEDDGCLETTDMRRR